MYAKVRVLECRVEICSGSEGLRTQHSGKPATPTGLMTGNGKTEGPDKEGRWQCWAPWLCYGGDSRAKAHGMTQERQGLGTLVLQLFRDKSRKPRGRSQAFLLELATFQLRGLVYLRGKMPRLF